jgi:acyl carrier protein
MPLSRNPGRRSSLRTAQNLIVENDDVSKTMDLAGDISRDDVIAEIRRHLAPFQNGDAPIVGETVISKDLTIDSLAVMDMIMELEDRFDITIPLNTVAEIHTVNELADTILKLHTER